MLNERLDWTIASGRFRPPLDMILHNAGYTYMFQVIEAYHSDKEKLMSLPGIGKRSRQNIELVMEDFPLVE